MAVRVGDMGALIDFVPRLMENERVTAETTLEDTRGEELLASVSPIRRLQPGDILDVVQKLRDLLARCDTTSFTLYASFEDLGGDDLEEHATKARRAIELASMRIYTLLGAVEKQPTFQQLRRELLNRRKSKRQDNE